MSVLVDTSVWIDHFRNGNAWLTDLMVLDLVLIHPVVVVEIACGTPPAPRDKTLKTIDLLQHCNQASLPEVISFIEREKLYGLECGLVDMVLLASTLITPGAKLWTLDKRLLNLARRFGVDWSIRN